MGLLDALRDPQFRSDVGTNTRNLFQQASNNAASNVTAPIDIMAWLLRKGGVPVPQNPMGGSEWAKDAGFTREVPDGAPKVAGDTLGMLALLLGAGKSKEIAGGLLKADESLKPVAGRMVDRYMDKIGGKMYAVPEGGGAKFTASEREKTIADYFWRKLDEAGDGYIGIRGDDAFIQNKFRNSWNRPDGEKTTRLPGVSVLGLGHNNIDEKSLLDAIMNAGRYGSNVYLLEGQVPSRIQHLANDVGERLMTENKILAKSTDLEKLLRGQPLP